MALRAALCCVLALKATAEGPAGVADDIFAAVRRDDAAAIERLYNADKSILDKTGPVAASRRRRTACCRARRKPYKSSSPWART